MSSDYNELVELAAEKFQEGNYQGCEPLLQQILLYGDHHPQVYQMLGTIYYDKGKFNQAIEFFQKALRLDPTSTEANVGLSVILNDLGRYEEAQEVFTKAKKLNDKKKEKNNDPFLREQFAIRHEELGDLYFQHAMDTEALAEYYKALNWCSAQEEVVIKIANTHLRLKQMTKAVIELKKLIRRNSSCIEAQFKLGSMYYSAGSLDEAQEQLESLLLISPNHDGALKLISQIRTNKSAVHDPSTEPIFPEIGMN